MPRLLRFSAFAVLAVALLALPGCDRPVDAITPSNDSLFIDRNTVPFNLEVWNNSPDLAQITFDVRPSRTWIQVTPLVAVSAAPTAGQLDKKVIKVTIDRRQLRKGTHEGEIRLSGRNLVTKVIKVRVIQDVDGQSAALKIINRGVIYDSPYLINFNFRLEDANGQAVVAEPAQFTVEAREGDTVVGADTGRFLRRGAARQLKVMLVLDYTLSIQQSPGAINAMENAAKGVLLPALNEDALVGIYEFHVESEPPQRVAPFTFDRAFLTNRINAIQGEYVQGFAGGSQAWNAIVAAAQEFGEGTSSAEDRYVILFSDGNDTSRLSTVNDVINACRARGVRVYAIGFGQQVNTPDLEAITSGTGGAFFPALGVSQLASAFESIVRDLDGQYTFRWASLARGNISFKPSFSIAINGSSSTYTADTNFVVRQHQGDELQGKLRIVPSGDEANTTVFLRADYVPRNIRSLRFYVQSEVAFQTSKVAVTNDGLVAPWTLNITQDPVFSGKWITLTAPGGATSGTPIQFATFGPLLRFDFAGAVENQELPFDVFYVDNSGYPNRQSFVVQGYVNTPPTAG